MTDMDPDTLRAKLADPYRVSCPHGHTSLRLSTEEDTVYCRSCQRIYAAAKLVDKRAGPSSGVVR
jgi:hypothetical protein